MNDETGRKIAGGLESIASSLAWVALGIYTLAMMTMCAGAMPK